VQSLLINDLEMNKALSREDLAAVRGGSNDVFAFGPGQNVAAGFIFASPITQVAPQIIVSADTTVDIASVIASMNTALSQAKLA
jgi:hypothetical protein